MVNTTVTSKRTADVVTSAPAADNGKPGSSKRLRRGAAPDSSPASTIADPNEQADEAVNNQANGTNGAIEPTLDTPKSDKGKPEAMSYYEKNDFNKILEAKFETVSVLKQGNIITLIHVADGQNVPGPFPVVLPTEVFPYSPETVTRLAHISAKERIGVIKNISFLDDFANLRDNTFICNAYGVQRLFTTGICTLSSLFPIKDAKYPPKNKQLCVMPLAPLWERAKAAIFKVFGEQPMFISTFYSGLSFTSQWKDKEKTAATTRGVSVSSPSKNPNIVPAMLPFESEVPIYDGREKFTLQNYTQLPRKRSEIEPGSAVVVIFTMKKIDSKDSIKPGVPEIFSISGWFYIQAVILLANPENTDLDPTNFDIKRHAMGVEFVDAYEKYYGELPSEEAVEAEAGDEI